MSIRVLHSCMEKFQLFFLSCMAPGAQLWFQPHLCMWATHRGLLPRLPWSTQVCPSEEGAQRWQQLGSWECLPQWGHGAEEKAAASRLWEPCLFPRWQGPVRGEGGCNGGPAPCTSFNNGASFLWHSEFPPQEFPVADFLTPVPSGCLLTANNSPLPGSVLQTPCSSI